MSTNQIHLDSVAPKTSTTVIRFPTRGSSSQGSFTVLFQNAQRAYRGHHLSAPHDRVQGGKTPRCVTNQAKRTSSFTVVMDSCNNYCPSKSSSNKYCSSNSSGNEEWLPLPQQDSKDLNKTFEELRRQWSFHSRRGCQSFTSPKSTVMHRKGSQDHIQPSCPTSGDVRRMFGTDTIRDTPEYARSGTLRDPPDWRPNPSDNLSPNLVDQYCCASNNIAISVTTDPRTLTPVLHMGLGGCNSMDFPRVSINSQGTHINYPNRMCNDEMTPSTRCTTPCCSFVRPEPCTPNRTPPQQACRPPERCQNSTVGNRTDRNSPGCILSPENEQMLNNTIRRIVESTLKDAGLLDLVKRGNIRSTASRINQANSSLFASTDSSGRGGGGGIDGEGGATSSREHGPKERHVRLNDVTKLHSNPERDQLTNKENKEHKSKSKHKKEKGNQ